ncbi:MAG: LacI family DNA-binding transcriptional regulator [Mycobacterium sp.]
MAGSPAGYDEQLGASLVAEQVKGYTPKRRPTMRHVAARAGVSLKTVSRVVNAEPGVSAELELRVNRAVRELGYRHNMAASSLRRANGKTQSIAVLLEDVANPYSSVLLRSVEDVADEYGAIVLSASLDGDPERERSLAELVLARRADGLVMMPAADDQEYLDPELRAGTPMVFVDRPPHGIQADSVLTTDRSGSTEAVRHLLAKGHRRIAFLTNSAAPYTARELYAGFVDAMAEAGLRPDPRLVAQELHDAVGANGYTSFMLGGDSPPTAIFAGQNQVTIGVIRALRRSHLEHSVAVVGFDDFPLADMLAPGVTVVAQDPSATGRTAAQILFHRLAGDVSPVRTHLVPTTLISRGSGEIPAPADVPRPA